MMNTTRLRELCDAFDAGALRGEEMRELVALVREACDNATKARQTLQWFVTFAQGVVDYVGDPEANADIIEYIGMVAVRYNLRF